MKQKTSQDLAKPLFIGALMGAISGIFQLLANMSVSDVPLYGWTSLISSFFMVAVYLVLGLLIKKDKICGDWNVTTSFVLASAAIFLVSGLLAVFSNDPNDAIRATTVTTGLVSTIVGVLMVGMYMVMVIGKINRVSRAVYYEFVIAVAIVVIVTLYHFIDVCINAPDASNILAAFGSLINKVLIAAVLIPVMKRGEVKARMFSNGLKDTEENKEE